VNAVYFAHLFIQALLGHLEGRHLNPQGRKSRFLRVSSVQMSCDLELITDVLVFVLVVVIGYWCQQVVKLYYTYLRELRRGQVHPA
jgi:hypothetical protein